MKNRYKIAALILAIFFLVFLPHNNLLNNVEDAMKDKLVLTKVLFASEQSKPNETLTAAERKTKQNALIKNLGDALAINDQSAISIIDLNHNEQFGVNENTYFHSASVTKLVTALAALRGVESGKFSLNQPMVVATFQYQFQQMVNQSNNDSWDFFNNLIGFDAQQQVVEDLGLQGIDTTKTQMTSGGTAQFLSKLYQGDLLNKTDRDLLFSYMQNTETENRISPAIPNGVTFYHKTGSFNGELHDAGIVLHPKNPFVIVIFTNDDRGTDWNSRFASFQKATTEVYNYFDSI